MAVMTIEQARDKAWEEWCQKVQITPTSSQWEAFMVGWNARSEYVEPVERRHSTVMHNLGAKTLLEAGVPAWLVWVKKPGHKEVTAHISYLVTDTDKARSVAVHLIPEELYPQVKAYAQGDTMKAIEFLAMRFPHAPVPDPVR